MSPLSFTNCAAAVAKAYAKHGRDEAVRLAKSYSANLGWDATKLLEAAKVV